jgi:hypothetical protein
MLLLIPRYGLPGAAAVATVLMVAVRGTVTPWLACRQLGFPFSRYLASIFVRPVLTGIPVFLFTYWCKANLWPGTNWLQLIVVSASVGLLYWGAAYFTCLEPEHKRLLWNWVTARWRPQYSVA